MSVFPSGERKYWTVRPFEVKPLGSFVAMVNLVLMISSALTITPSEPSTINPAGNWLVPSGKFFSLTLTEVGVVAGAVSSTSITSQADALSPSISEMVYCTLSCRTLSAP